MGNFPICRALLGVVEARAVMVAATQALAPEAVSLSGAFDRVLAEDILAVRDQPPSAIAAMDGFAVRSIDTPGVLRIAGESRAGHLFEGVCSRGKAVQISTGAVVPDGADCVILHEEVAQSGRYIVVPAVRPQQNIRPRGGDFKTGSLVLPRRRCMGSSALLLAAACGRSVLLARKKPRIAILSGGDELAAPGSVPGSQQVFDSASIALAARVHRWGGHAECLPLIRDNLLEIATAAEEGFRRSDLLVMIGGASHGDHDLARKALTRFGLVLAVESVSVRPGKPTWFGTTSLGRVLGLPGNPVAALVSAELFLRPLLAAMLDLDTQPRFCRASLERPLPLNGYREHYLPSFLNANQGDRLTVRALDRQGASLLTTFFRANSLIRLPPLSPAMPADSIIDVLPLEQQH